MIEPLLSSCRRIALAALAALSGLVLILSPVAAAAPGDAGRFRYVLVAQGNDASTMSASIEDIERAVALRRGEEALLYVRQGRAAWVIRDAATLRQAEAIFAPQRALGEQQSELGSRQADLGSRQAALGAEQARIGARQAVATPGQQDALGRQQDELGRQQNELGRQQNALGRQQDALGREQVRLGREAETQLRALVADAIQRGVAQRVD